MDQQQDFDPEFEVVVLNYATRLLFSSMDQEVMLERAAESLLDLSKAFSVGVFELDDKSESLRARGGMVEQAYSQRDFEVPMADSPYQKIIDGRAPGIFGMVHTQGLPCPVYQDGLAESTCLVLPLLAVDNRCIGVVTLEYGKGFELSPRRAQPLMIFTTTAALALETARLFTMAVHDGLTGCFVRRYFDIRMAEELARISRYGGRLALIVIDMDKFKTLNDQGGHLLGDEALKRMAGVLQEAVRDDVDVVCRYGGDEFVLILPNTDLPGAKILAGRILESLKHVQLHSGDTTYGLAASMGIAATDSENLLEIKELFDRADQAVYKVKEAGGGHARAWGE